MTPGWILGVIFFMVGVLSLLVLNRIGGTSFSLCPLRTITGFPCFLCGGTTASLHLASGNVPSALVSNPLVTISLILFALWSLLWIGLGLRAEVTLPASLQTSGLILCVVVNWAYLISQRTGSPEEGKLPLKSSATWKIPGESQPGQRVGHVDSSRAEAFPPMRKSLPMIFSGNTVLLRQTANAKKSFPCFPKCDSMTA